MASNSLRDTSVQKSKPNETGQKEEPFVYVHSSQISGVTFLKTAAEAAVKKAVEVGGGIFSGLQAEFFPHKGISITLYVHRLSSHCLNHTTKQAMEPE